MTQARRHMAAAVVQMGTFDMEFIIAILVVVLALAGLDAAALTWGVDSRDLLADDRVR